MADAKVLFAYPITQDLYSTLQLKFDLAYPNPELLYGLYLVETSDPKLQLVMNREALEDNFEYEAENSTAQMFVLTPRSVQEYMARRQSRR